MDHKMLLVLLQISVLVTQITADPLRNRHSTVVQTFQSSVPSHPNSLDPSLNLGFDINKNAQSTDTAHNLIIPSVSQADAISFPSTNFKKKKIRKAIKQSDDNLQRPRTPRFGEKRQIKTVTSTPSKLTKTEIVSLTSKTISSSSRTPDASHSRLRKATRSIRRYVNSQLSTKKRRDILTPSLQVKPTKYVTDAVLSVDYYDDYYDNYNINDEFLSKLDSAFQEVIIGKSTNTVAPPTVTPLLSSVEVTDIFSTKELLSSTIPSRELNTVSKLTSKSIDTNSVLISTTSSVIKDNEKKNEKTRLRPSKLLALQSTVRPAVLQKSNKSFDKSVPRSATPWPFRYTTTRKSTQRQPKRISSFTGSLQKIISSSLNPKVETTTERTSVSSSIDSVSSTSISPLADFTILETHVESQTSVKGLSLTPITPTAVLKTSKLEDLKENTTHVLTNSSTIDNNNNNTLLNVTEETLNLTDSKANGASRFLSQIGLAPEGTAPMGIQPFGAAPQGLSPFGSSPSGLNPLGNFGNNTDLPPVEHHEKVVGERYHMQVKKPDGTTVGDYVVVDAVTGDHNGVRYEAVEDADPTLIRKALLEFFSLDPNVDNGR